MYGRFARAGLRCPENTGRLPVRRIHDPYLSISENLSTEKFLEFAKNRPFYKIKNIIKTICYPTFYKS